MIARLPMARYQALFLVTSAAVIGLLAGDTRMAVAADVRAEAVAGAYISASPTSRVDRLACDPFPSNIVTGFVLRVKGSCAPVGAAVCYSMERSGIPSFTLDRCNWSDARTSGVFFTTDTGSYIALKVLGIRNAKAARAPCTMIDDVSFPLELKRGETRIIWFVCKPTVEAKPRRRPSSCEPPVARSDTWGVRQTKTLSKSVLTNDDRKNCTITARGWLFEKNRRPPGLTIESGGVLKWKVPRNAAVRDWTMSYFAMNRSGGRSERVAVRIRVLRNREYCITSRNGIAYLAAPNINYPNGGTPIHLGIKARWCYDGQSVFVQTPSEINWGKNPLVEVVGRILPSVQIGRWIKGYARLTRSIDVFFDPQRNLVLYSEINGVPQRTGEIPVPPIPMFKGSIVMTFRASGEQTVELIGGPRIFYGKTNGVNYIREFLKREGHAGAEFALDAEGPDTSWLPNGDLSQCTYGVGAAGRYVACVPALHADRADSRVRNQR